MPVPTPKLRPLRDAAPLPGTILLIEDDPATRELFEFALAAAGLSVTAAATGEEALRKLAAGRPAALVLDLVLPGVTGAVVGAAARAAYGAGLPIIVITGYGDAAGKSRGLGPAAALDKPFPPAALVAAVRAAL